LPTLTAQLREVFGAEIQSEAAIQIPVGRLGYSDHRSSGGSPATGVFDVAEWCRGRWDPESGQAEQDRLDAVIFLLVAVR
jgi:hypothetical protein